MASHVRVERVVPCPLAVVRRRASLKELARVIPEACGVVWEVVRSHGLTGAGRHVAVYLDHEMNLEVGVEMTAPFHGVGEVVGSSTPGGIVARATHLGPYERLHMTHTIIHEWCFEYGYTLAGPNWEIYDHWEDAWNADPTHIRTDVVYLLKEGTPHGV